jgi:5'-nucleotidase
MKSLKYVFSAILVFSIAITTSTLHAERLVILHTNDTHSHIDPIDGSDMGGILRRKALIDSVRAVEPNVLLIDAGDIVQGTLYFHLYKGELEQRLMNELGYDMQIMGNHEFDNGIDALAKMYANATPQLLSTNYDLTETPLHPLFSTYSIREFAGKKIGFLAINLNPKGMIADGNATGIKVLDWKTAANATAWHLKHNEKVDAVIAITHVGYSRAPSDSLFVDLDIAANTSDIDIIIGGHSHTLINPADPSSKAWRVPNVNGDSVLITQTGRYGAYIGEIDIDLTNMAATSRVIPIDKRLDNRIDPAIAELIRPYREGVASLYSTWITKAARDLSNKEPGLLNFAADFILDRGKQLSPNVQLSIVNKGGIRRSLAKGKVSEGELIDMMPFANRTTVLDVRGSDLAEAFDVMALRNGDGVSNNVNITFNPSTGKCTSIYIDGKPINNDATYRVATIDYLANGGDYMTPLTHGTKIAESTSFLYDDLIVYLRDGKMKGRSINPDNTSRMKAATK